MARKKAAKKPAKPKTTVKIAAHTRSYPKRLPPRTKAGKFRKGRTQSTAQPRLFGG